MKSRRTRIRFRVKPGEVIITWTKWACLRRENASIINEETVEVEQRVPNRIQKRKGVARAEGRGGWVVEKRTRTKVVIEKGGSELVERERRTFISCGYTKSLPVTKQVGQAMEGANFVWMSLRYGRVSNHVGKCTFCLYSHVSTSLSTSTSVYNLSLSEYKYFPV